MKRLYPVPGEIELAEAYAYPRTPWLRANMVSSADGAAWLDGRAGGLGNESDRRILSLLRAMADVVLVGAATTRIERYGPVRPQSFWGDLRQGRPPVPPLAIVSRALDLDFDAFAEADPRPIVITTDSARADRRERAEKYTDVIVAGDERVDLEVAVDELIVRGHTRLLTEGGPRLLAQLVDRLDELCLTVSPVLVSGDAARILNGTPPAEAVRLRLTQVLEDEGFLFIRYLREE